MGGTSTDDTSSGNRAAETKMAFDTKNRKQKARDEQAKIEESLSTADAYRQIRERQASATGGGIKVGNVTIPTTTGIVGGMVSQFNLSNIESVLKGGGKAVFSKGGTLVGATDSSGRYTGRPEGDPRGYGTLVYGQKDPRTRDDSRGENPPSTPQTPELTPEVTPEVVPDEPVLSSKRRTRGKRFGGAGDFGEGILVRNTQR